MNLFAVLSGVTIILTIPSCISAHPSAFNTVFNGKSEFHNRSSKWLPLIITVGSELCNSTDSHEVGTCLTSAQCRSASGLPKGKCASGLGVCCVIVTACSDVITKNNTYFRSVQFPDIFVPNEYHVCRTKIKKPKSNICQVLLTFHDMELAKQDRNHGRCLVDNILIFGAADVHFPHLCGPLSKQHMYLEFGRGNHISLSIVTDGTQDNSVRRKWNVQVAFFECEDPYRAPPGCLQYFTGPRGSVKILGYPENPHLAGLRYTICIRREELAESIFWFPCRNVSFEKAFHFNGPNLFMTLLEVFFANCTGDYIAIMNDETRTSNLFAVTTHDRFCGNRLQALPPFFVFSTAVPYIVLVRTDMTEDEDERENAGFCLEWNQILWKLKMTSRGMPMAPPEMGIPEGPELP